MMLLVKGIFKRAAKGTVVKRVVVKGGLTAACLGTYLLGAMAFAEAPVPQSQNSAEQLTEQAQLDQQLTRISLNTANADTLASNLIGIGEAKAEAIIAWREANGRFDNVEQLLEVKGIGKATLEKNKSRITL